MKTIPPQVPLHERPTGRLELLPSRNFCGWLASVGASLAFSTYQTAKLFFVGLKPDGSLSVVQRTFKRCMGLWSDGQSLWLGSAFQIWRLENVLAGGRDEAGYDRLYVPRLGYTVGNLDVHDVAVDGRGRPVFVSTLFSCLATVDEQWNFRPLWKPPFVSRLAAEDRCHLNGLALDGGTARYATVCGRTDHFDGWRDCRHDGGCVIDVDTGNSLAEGLSMPHSPRVYADRLWLLESGTGHLGSVDGRRGKFEPLAFCPGYVRGLAFVSHYAVVGLSRPRSRSFSGLALESGLARRRQPARCGLAVIDLETCRLAHWLWIEGTVQELYDVVVLPGVLRPKALGFKTEQIGRRVWFEEQGRISSWAARKKKCTGDPPCPQRDSEDPSGPSPAVA
jgi:uncharacterized protein (TIGR03032 family)